MPVASRGEPAIVLGAIAGRRPGADVRGGLTSRTVVASTVLAATVGASFVFSLVAISAERDWERQVAGSLEELALVE